MNKLLSTKVFLISQLLILALSLLFLGGIYYVLNPDKFLKSNLTQSYQPVTVRSISFNLEITNPDDETLVFEKDLLISGRTNPQAAIIVNLDNFYTGLTAGEDGEFSKLIELATGLNEIAIAGFDEKGNSEIVTRTIYYSEEKI